MAGWDAYLILIFLLGALFFASAVYALTWAVKHGQLKDLQAGATSIFTEEEPLGVQTDFFPGKRPKEKSKSNPSDL